MSHDVLACIEASGRPKTVHVATNGYAEVLHVSCHCGHEEVAVRSLDWQPKGDPRLGVCPICRRAVVRTIGVQFNGVKAHARCAADHANTWTPEQTANFIREYNARVPVKTLLVRYGMTRAFMWRITKRLRAEGHHLIRGIPGNRFRYAVSDQARERHQMAMAGMR